MITTFIANVHKTSKEYALFSDGVCVLCEHFTNIDGEYALSSQSVGGTPVRSKVSQSEYEKSVTHVAAEISLRIEKNQLPEVTQVIVKVAVPGNFFQEHKQITSTYLAELKKRVQSAPLQVVPLLQEINAISKEFPHAHVHAASDTAFYATLPAAAREYGVSAELTKVLELYRFGLNGLSTAAAVAGVPRVIGRDPEKSIVCHIADTVSVSAVLNGKAVDTSAGLAPASGFPLGSQAGDIDASALLKIMRHKNLRPAEAEVYLDNSGGLQALTGTSDINILHKRISQNDSQAAQALQLLTYKIQRAIAAATVALEGLDVLIFTGTIAVQSPELRAEILKKLNHLHIATNQERNNLAMGKTGVISQRNSQVKVVVLKSDEMSEMNAVINQDKLSKVQKMSIA
jgi:acetate kinase